MKIRLDYSDEHKQKYVTIVSPATKMPVTLPVGKDGWKVCGTIDKPTIHPSILRNGDRNDKSTPREHFFVTDGKVRYLTDCDHQMAGQAVDMVDVDDFFSDMDIPLSNTLTPRCFACAHLGNTCNGSSEDNMTLWCSVGIGFFVGGGNLKDWEDGKDVRY